MITLPHYASPISYGLQVRPIKLIMLADGFNKKKHVQAKKIQS